jgi:predicted Zn-dependent peptidase
MLRTKTLQNGLRIVLDRRPREHQVTIVIGIPRGARDEPAAYAGCLHLIEHLISSRFPWNDEISREMDKVGADLNAQTSEDCTMFYCTIPSRSVSWALALMIELVLEPRFTEDDVALEREVVLEEYREDKDLVETDLERGRTLGLFRDHPLATNVFGRPSTLQRLSPSRITRLWRRLLDPRQMVVTVVGGFEPSRVVPLIKQRLGTLQPPPFPLPRQPSMRITKSRSHCSLFLYDRLKQVSFYWSFLLPGFRSRSRFPLMILANILGGRDSSPLYLELRKRGLVYTLSTDLWLFGEGGYLTLSSATSREPKATELVRSKFFEVITTIGSFLRRYKSQGVPAREHDLSVTWLCRDLRREYRDTVHVGRSYTAQMCCYGRIMSLPTLLRRIRSTTREEVHAAARKFLVMDRLHLSAAGPLTRRDREKLHAMFPDSRTHRRSP